MAGAHHHTDHGHGYAGQPVDHEHVADAHGHAGHGHAPARPWARVRRLLLPERRDVVTVLIFALAVAVLSLASPIAVEALVNTVAFGILLWPVLVLAGVLMACLGLAAALKAMQIYVVECMQRRLFVRVAADYAHRIPRVKLEGIDGRSGPELANRFFDVLTFQKSLATLMLEGVSLVVTVLVGMTVLAFYHPFLLGFDVVLLLLIVFAVFALGWGGVRTALDESHIKYDLAAWMEELLRCLRTFKFAGGPAMALERADALAGAYVAARRRHFRVVWRQTVFALGLQVVASTALLALGGYLVTRQQLTLGQLVAAELIVTLVVASVSKIGKYAESFYDLMASAEKLGILTDLPLERVGGEELPNKGTGMAVRVLAVDAITGRALANRAEWRAAPGERVAVVGPAGAGKSTVFEALCGLREPDRGHIELDGVNVRGLDLTRLREQVALVGGIEVFVGTVFENVRVGRANVTPADVRDALRQAGVLAAVNELPHGLDTPLGPDGGPLSGAYVVRLVLARALVTRPRLLILDEVLDTLHPEDNAELLDYLFDRTNPWTLLVATANPAVVGRCDRIVVLSPDVPSESPLP